MCPLQDSTRSDRDSNASDSVGDLPEDSGWEIDSAALLKLKNQKLKIFQQANQKVSLSSLFTQFSIHLESNNTSNGWSQRGICPFSDHQEKTASFHLNVELNRFNCFGCNRGGSTVDFLAFYEKIDRLVAARKILGNEILSPPPIVIIDRSGIENALLEFANFHREVYKNNPDSAEFLEKVSWSIDIFVKMYGSIDKVPLDELRLRIEKAKEYLNLENKM